MLEQNSYLLQNQLNPFPISGNLTLSDSGQLRFELDAKAAGASLGWLEKELGVSDLKQQIEAGTAPVVFDIAVSGRKISWPKSLGGSGLKFEDGDRKWIVSLQYPSGGGISQLLNMMSARSLTKPWKAALAAAGAN